MYSTDKSPRGEEEEGRWGPDRQSNISLDDDDNSREMAGFDEFTTGGGASAASSTRSMTAGQSTFTDYNTRRRRAVLLWSSACFCCLLLVILIPVSITVSRKGNNNESNGVASQTAGGPVALRASIEKSYANAEVDSSALTKTDSPAFMALAWLAANTLLEEYDHTREVQRFVLATLFYSTNAIETVHTPQPPAWMSAERWLSDAHECEWEGVVCNERQRIVGLSMEENDMTGALPMELALIRSHLETLDFTSNDIFMEGSSLDVFAKLTNLKTLLMDDNFLTTTDGMPKAFRNLSNLEKIRLSYNILSGEVEPNYYENLVQLTHLEVESNYLSGDIPASLVQLENLVYMYIRRNSMSFSLDFIKTANLDNLFAMWMDSNEIIGTIPTEIGVRLPSLASLSITNTTLQGTIPTEMGMLEGLRRVWLYENELNGDIPSEIGNCELLEVLEVHGNNLGGSMPPGVCELIRESSYNHKSLSSDCNSVSCTNCCTTCF